MHRATFTDAGNPIDGIAAAIVANTSVNGSPGRTARRSDAMRRSRNQSRSRGATRA